MLELRGSMVALVTPFRDGVIDAAALSRLVDMHVASGTSALVPCGTTGESATLSHAEHERVIDLTIQAANGRIPVIAGTGSNNTAEAIRLTQHAKDAGADASLLIVPYYNKPTQRGLFLHYKAIAESVDLPLIPYNIAARTGVNMEPDTVALLADIPNIIAIKEASGNLEQMSCLRALCGDRLILLSGDDALTLPVLAIGGTGVISVLANIIPQDVARMVALYEAGEIEQARELHERMLPLVQALFIETNPIPLKTAMGWMGQIAADVRLPLCEMSEKHQAVLRQALEHYGITVSAAARS
jgi:4-hydroxy-tetrahydrodipicolinate synthase